ncbi:MAG: 7-carboxy-7-deazaguanine synthase QueE [Elusimicrobiales bacterium]
MKAPVAEIFSSIQGEGIFLGARQIFVRFCGCNLKCSYCDEPASRAAGKMMTAERILREISRLGKKPHHSVSLTGGEPLLHADFIAALAPRIKTAGLPVYLETNAALPEKFRLVSRHVDIVAADWKFRRSTGEELAARHRDFLSQCRGRVFVKAVLTGGESRAELEQCAGTVADVSAHIPLVIQPATPVSTQAVKTAEKFLKLARRKLARVIILPQQHPIWGVK